MGIGLGIVFVVIGLILVLGVVQFDISFVDDVALGWILLIVGIAAIILALVMNNQRSRTKHVEERRYDAPPRCGTTTERRRGAGTQVPAPLRRVCERSALGGCPALAAADRLGATATGVAATGATAVG